MAGAGLRLRRFSLGFRGPGEIRWLLEDVDLEVPGGRLYLLRGPSGAGKSTFLDLLAGELDLHDAAWSQRGRLRFAGGSRRPRVAALFQQDGLWDDLSPLANVALAAEGDRAEAARLLARVGLPDPPERVSQLSGGQRKRVALARALARRPGLLLLDEPTAGLDAEAARQVLALIGEVAAGPELTVILCTHDLELVRPFAAGELVLPGDGRLLLAAPGGPELQAGPRPATAAGSTWLMELLLGASSLVQSLLQTLGALLPEPPLRCLLRGMEQLLLLVPFLALAGFFVGSLALHFVLGNDPLHGAMASTLLAGTGKVLVAVLLPLLGALLYAAPAVGGGLARLGAMARDRQLAAYRGLGQSVRREVLSPLLWGHLVALPLGAAAMAVGAVHGAWAADAWARGTAWEGFLPCFLEGVTGLDLAWFLGKGLGSAFLVAWLPWHLARRRGLSPGELAHASRRASVAAAMGILVFQGLCLFPQLK